MQLLDGPPLSHTPLKSSSVVTKLPPTRALWLWARCSFVCVGFTADVVLETDSVVQASTPNNARSGRMSDRLIPRRLLGVPSPLKQIEQFNRMSHFDGNHFSGGRVGAVSKLILL